MFWKGFKECTLVCFIIGVLGLVGCNSKTTPTLSSQNIEKKVLSTKEQIVRLVESKLSINAVEDYSIEIIEKKIDDDTLMDALVLVNRKAYTYKYFKEKKNFDFFESVGHTASYNYVFVKLGGLDHLIYGNPLAVGSNVDYPLTADFIKLTSPTTTDFYVTYRIRNSLHRNYYTVRNQQLFLVFSYPVFDKIGDPKPESYTAVAKVSPVRIAKDIALYKAKIKNYNPTEIKDLFDYKPEGIITTDSLVGYFILDESKMKYVTPMQPVK